MSILTNYINCKIKIKTIKDGYSFNCILLDVDKIGVLVKIEESDKQMLQFVPFSNIDYIDIKQLQESNMPSEEWMRERMR